MPLDSRCRCTITIDRIHWTASFTFCPLHEAAPELYDALQEVVARMHAQLKLYPDRGAEPEALKMLENWGKVLAKARRETDAEARHMAGGFYCQNCSRVLCAKQGDTCEDCRKLLKRGTA